jgi:hypothetical protein
MFEIHFSLKDDLDFDIKLVRINGNCLEFLSNNFRNNVEVVKVAIETTKDAYKFSSSEIQYLGDLTKQSTKFQKEAKE